MIKYILIGVNLMLMLSLNSSANISLPNIFSDNMVLQRNADVKIWGWAKPGEQVTVTNTWNSEEVQVKTPNSGYWELFISTPDVKGTQEVTISGYTKVILKNVLLGEVWLVSGQSNMEWSFNAGIDHQEEALAMAENSQIRLFSVEHRSAKYPQQDLAGKWEVSNSESMKDFSAIAFFFGNKLNKELKGVPIGLINSSWGGTPAEVWMPEEVIAEKPELSKAAKLLPDVEWGPNKPGNLYNAMIAPLIPFQLAGILWYQGESNVDNADYYENIFSNLIISWRKKWGEDIPFYYAQIAPYSYGEGNKGVKVRDAQRRVKLPNTGMVTTSDIGDIKDIHPRNKMGVGNRFADLALHEVYGKNKQPYSPDFQNLEMDGNKLVLHFKDAEGLYIPKERNESQFEIADEDKVFYTADYSIKENRVTLKSRKVKNPVYARFSWGDILESNLFNKANLPASSFTTAD